MPLSKSGLHLGWVKLVIIYSAWGEVLRKQDAGLDWTSPISKKLVYFLNYFIFIWTAAMRAGELGRWCPQRQRQGSLWILSEKLQWCWLSLVALVGGWRASAVSLSSVGQQRFAFQEEINWLHLAEIEVCEIDVLLGFFPQSYWMKILLEDVEVLFQTLT